MKLNSKFLSIKKKYLFLLLAVVLIITIFSFGKTENIQKETVNIKINADDRYALTATSSEYTIVEFFDLHCRYCKSLHELKEKHKAEFTNINIILRNHPLLDSGASATKVLIGECVFQQRGVANWLKYIDSSYKNFDKKDHDPFFYALGESLVEDKELFKVCLSDTSLMSKIQNDRTTNVINQITFVPTLVVFKGNDVVKIYNGVGGRFGLEIIKYYNSLTSKSY